MQSLQRAKMERLPLVRGAAGNALAILAGASLGTFTFQFEELNQDLSPFVVTVFCYAGAASLSLFIWLPKRRRHSNYLSKGIGSGVFGACAVLLYGTLFHQGMQNDAIAATAVLGILGFALIGQFLKKVRTIGIREVVQLYFLLLGIGTIMFLGK